MSLKAKLSVDDATVIAAFLHDLPIHSKTDSLTFESAWDALMRRCPHPGYVHGGSMGNVCSICGGMEMPDPPCEHVTGEELEANACGHSDTEDCMNCTCCGRCREDLDSNDVCIDCGGEVED